MLTQIRISNFKSFNDVTTSLNSFNVLIGANGSGKSNFINIFKFLNDIVNKGLDDAISMQGGIKYLKNLNNAGDVPLRIEVKSKERLMFPLTKNGVLYHVEFSDLDYSIQLEFKESLENYEISEKVSLKGIFYKSSIKPRKRLITSSELIRGKSGKLYNIEFIMSNIKGNMNAKLISQDKLPINKEDILSEHIFRLVESMTKQHPEISILNSPLSDFPVRWSSIFRNIAFYDIDPKICKQPTKINGEKRLKENGENLAIIVKKIMKDGRNKSKFLNLVKDLLPVIQNIDTEQFFDNNSIIFKIIEKYSNENFILAGLSSDGTNNLIAFIIVLFFTNNSSLTLVEEPERNIHPKLMSKLVQMMVEASKKKQIIVTTHNPELLKHSNVEDVLFISRDENGFSTVSNPSESEDVKMFLNEEIGIDDLFIDDLLM